ncbi:hypothetical protein OWM07_03215 [Deferribacter thermophilus]|uniref:hypothetical protein n=1 Tax=Deferribacter thermophilus TaxID=53573 RepID=UPI003C1ED691
MAVTINLDEIYKKIEEEIEQEEEQELEEEKTYKFFEHLLRTLALNSDEKVVFKLPFDLKLNNASQLYDDIKDFLVAKGIDEEQFEMYIEYARQNIFVDLEEDFGKKIDRNMKIKDFLDRVKDEGFRSINTNIKTGNAIIDLSIQSAQFVLSVYFFFVMLALYMLLQMKHEHDKRKQREQFEKYKKAVEAMQKVTKRHEKFLKNLENPDFKNQFIQMQKTQNLLKNKEDLTMKDIVKHIHQNALLIKTEKQLKKQLKQLTKTKQHNKKAKSKNISYFENKKHKQGIQQTLKPKPAPTPTFKIR